MKTLLVAALTLASCAVPAETSKALATSERKFIYSAGSFEGTLTQLRLEKPQVITIWLDGHLAEMSNDTYEELLSKMGAIGYECASGRRQASDWVHIAGTISTFFLNCELALQVADQDVEQLVGKLWESRIYAEALAGNGYYDIWVPEEYADDTRAMAKKIKAFCALPPDFEWPG